MWGVVIISLIGRICIAALFLFFGAASIFYWEIVFTDLDTALIGYTMVKGGGQYMGPIWDFLAENVWSVLIIGIGMQILGGLFVLFGFFQRVGAFLLILYMIVNSCLYYPFWLHEGEQASYLLVLFLKNIAIIGGLVLLLRRRSISGSMYEMLDEEL